MSILHAAPPPFCFVSRNVSTQIPPASSGQSRPCCHHPVAHDDVENELLAGSIYRVAPEDEASENDAHLDDTDGGQDSLSVA